MNMSSTNEYGSKLNATAHQQTIHSKRQQAEVAHQTKNDSEIVHRPSLVKRLFCSHLNSH